MRKKQVYAAMPVAAGIFRCPGYPDQRLPKSMIRAAQESVLIL